MGGVSGTESINCVILLLKVSMLCMALVSAGMQQQTKLQNCSTPYTFTSFANQASVLVLCAVKKKRLFRTFLDSTRLLPK